VQAGVTTNEIPMFPLLLGRTGITGAVITADAMHAQRGHATYLAGRGAHFLPTSRATSQACPPGSRPCPGARSRPLMTPAGEATAALSAVS
jgi:hypothetical protein